MAVPATASLKLTDFEPNGFRCTVIINGDAGNDGNTTSTIPVRYLFYIQYCLVIGGFISGNL